MFTNALLLSALAACVAAQSKVLFFTHVPNPITDGEAAAITYVNIDVVEGLSETASSTGGALNAHGLKTLANPRYPSRYSTNDTQSPVTILLRQGQTNDLKTLMTLTDNSYNSQFIWTPPKSLPNGNDYALQITVSKVL